MAIRKQTVNKGEKVLHEAMGRIIRDKAHFKSMDDIFRDRTKSAGEKAEAVIAKLEGLGYKLGKLEKDTINKNIGKIGKVFRCLSGEYGPMERPPW